jgi:hypothetical protein
MGWKTFAFGGLVLVAAAAAAVVVPRVPGYWLASDAEVKRAVQALYTQTAGLRKAIGGELLYAKQIEPDSSDRSDPDYGAYHVRISETGTIVVRSRKYDVVLVFRPLPGGEKAVPWRCRVSPARYVVEGCEPGGDD